MKEYQHKPERKNDLEQYSKNNVIKLREKGVGIVPSIDLLKAMDIYLLPITANGKIGFINSFGEIVTMPTFDDYRGQFVDKDSLVIVGQNKKYGILDSSGKLIVPCIYVGITMMKDSIVILRTEDNLYSLVNLRNSTTIVEVGKYKKMTCARRTNEFIEVWTNTGRGVINLEGRLIIPAEFNWISSYDAEKNSFGAGILISEYRKEEGRSIDLFTRRAGYDKDGNVLFDTHRPCEKAVWLDIDL